MRYDAGKERWSPMEIRGVPGYFFDMRVDRKTVPEPVKMWELADNDSDGMPCRYRKGILVNFYGTFLTMGELPIDEPEFEEGYIETEADWEFTDGPTVMLKEILEQECMKGGM